MKVEHHSQCGQIFCSTTGVTADVDILSVVWKPGQETSTFPDHLDLLKGQKHSRVGGALFTAPQQTSLKCLH